MPSASKVTSVIKKVAIVGDPEVGKNALLERVAHVSFDRRYLETIGTIIGKHVQNHDFPESDMRVEATTLVWDVTGKESFRSLRPTYLEGTEGLVVVGDATRRETLESMPEWADAVYGSRGVGRKIPTAFVVNKVDKLPERREAVLGYAEYLADDRGPVFLASAQTGYGCQEPFAYVGRRLASEFVVRRAADARA